MNALTCPVGVNAVPEPSVGPQCGIVGVTYNLAEPFEFADLLRAAGGDEFGADSIEAETEPPDELFVVEWLGLRHPYLAFAENLVAEPGFGQQHDIHFAPHMLGQQAG